MLTIMAKLMHAANKNLGAGTYYERGGHVLSHLTDWVTVKLERTLVLDERRVRLMEQEYATTSDDPVEAISGAWKLRRDLMREGYDSVIAVDGPDRFRIFNFADQRSEERYGR